MTGESSDEVVQELEEQVEEVKAAVRTFLVNVTRTAATSIETDVAVLWEDHHDEDDDEGAPNVTIVYSSNGSTVVVVANGNGTNDTATNASALVADLGRRLEHDGCENGARLDVAIVFEEEVTLGVIEAIKEEWPALANFTAGVEACEEAAFDPIASEAPPDVDDHRDTSILLLAMSVGGAILCCCACCLFLVAGRRRRRCAEEENDGAYPRKKPNKRCEKDAEKTGLMVGELSSFLAAQNRPREVNLTFRVGKF